MPILKIPIDGEDFEFKILPINKVVEFNIKKRYSNKEGIIDRAGFLSHIVKEPKMTKSDWNELPVSLITRIMRTVEYYTESIFYKQKELRKIYTQINVFEDEIDDMFRFLENGTDDWAWMRIRGLEREIESLKKEKEKIEKSLEYLKDDKVIFEEGKEIDYDVQPLQLENREKRN